MLKRIPFFLSLCLILISLNTQAQTTEELTQLKEQKSAELAELEGQLKELTGKVDGLKAEVASLTDQLTPYPRWDVGAFGTIGFNFTQFNDWLSKEAPSTTASTIGFTLNGFANMDQKKYFWRNGANLNLSWIKFDDRDDDVDGEDFEVAADAFNLTSLFGYKFNDKLAASALAEYRTSMLEGRFNDPGYLDLGVGATWTPIQNLVVVVHPLNYNFVFSDSAFDFQSSLGAKVVADYQRKLSSGISWKSNLSAFISYEDPEELSNWTWINGFSTAYKGIGVGLEFGLRMNKQESLASILAGNLEEGDNPLQSYFVLGLSYAL